MNKKYLFLILAGAVCFMLCSCGEKTTPAETNTADVTEPPSSSETVVVKKPEDKPTSTNQAVTMITLGRTYSVSDFVDFTVVSIEATSMITSTNDGSGVYYENSNSEHTYIDVVFEVTNKSTFAIHSDDLMIATAKNANGSEYLCDLYAVETNGKTDLSIQETINPLTSARVHTAISVPKDETEYDIKFVMNEEQFSYKFSMTSTGKLSTELQVGDIIEKPEYAALEFVDARFTETVLPSNTSGYYRYYQTDNADTTYLALEFRITNYQGVSRDIDTFVGATATFMDKYEYTGFVVSEDNDRQGLSSYNEIAPLQTSRVIYLIEIPKTVMEMEYTVEVLFERETRTYSP